MGREEWLLHEAIKLELDRASKALWKLDDLEQELSSEEANDPEDDRDVRAKHELEFHVARACRGIGVLAERLGAMSIEREMTALLHSRSKLSETDREFDGEIHSQALASAFACFAPLSAMLNAKSVTSQDVFKNILAKTAVILLDRGITPKNEAEVRNAILEVCRYAFSDAKREVEIAKSLKHYKGDLGVSSLRAIAEFKFVNSKAEMKASLDGVYADMKGYRDPDWDTFYSVFYMTAPFYTQQDVEREFELVGADRNWTPIVVSGAGSRK